MVHVGIVKVSVKEAVGNMTVTIKVTDRQLSMVRLRVGGWILKLACKVMGTKYGGVDLK
jgi:hypothetical protein